MTATAASSGAVLTVEYEQPTAFPGITKQCLAFQVLTSNGDPDGVLRPRGCNDDSAYQGGLHSELLPVARGYLLVQPGRLDTSGEGDEPVRVYGVDPNLLALDGLVTPGIVARELAAAPWYGGALFVYTHSDESGVPRVFAYLVQERSRRTRAVRH
jgi:hypothetical protein